MKKSAIILALVMIGGNVSYAEGTPVTNYILPDTIKVEDINLFKQNTLQRESQDYNPLGYIDNEGTVWINYKTVRELMYILAFGSMFIILFFILILKTWKSGEKPSIIY